MIHRQPRIRIVYIQIRNRPEMEETTAAAAARASCELPEKILLEILARVAVDPAALFRCASTCKRWRSLIAAPSFLRRCWPDDAPSSLAGFFTRQPHGRLDLDDGGATTPYQIFFVPTPGGGRSILGARRRLLASFIPGAPHGLLDCAFELAADCHRSSATPPADTPPCSTFFKVAIIVSSSYVTADKECSLYTFSSDEQTWSAPRKCLEELRQRSGAGAGGSQFFLAKDAVVCGGVAHWLVSCFEGDPAKYYTFEVSAETNQASLTEISFPSANAGEPAPEDFGAKVVLSAAADGALSLLCLYNEPLPVPSASGG